MFFPHVSCSALPFQSSSTLPWLSSPESSLIQYLNWFFFTVLPALTLPILHILFSLHAFCTFFSCYFYQTSTILSACLCLKCCPPNSQNLTIATSRTSVRITVHDSTTMTRIQNTCMGEFKAYITADQRQYESPSHMCGRCAYCYICHNWHII